MSKPRYPHDEQGQISCETCLKEIPHSESMSSEVEEYVAYYCGLECYEAWTRQQVEDKFEDHT